MNFLLGGGLGKLKFSEKIKVSPPRIRLARRRWHTLPPPFLGHSSAFRGFLGDFIGVSGFRAL